MTKSEKGKAASGKKRKKYADAFLDSRPKNALKLPKEVEEEADPEWRRWFIAVEQRRQDQKRRTEKTLIVSEAEKDEGRITIARHKSTPVAIGHAIKAALPQTKAFTLGDEYQEITRLWVQAVGDEIAKESALYSFKAGVMTVEIYSSILLQELRQFHQHAILADLRDIWTLKTPLLSLKFKVGDKKA